MSAKKKWRLIEGKVDKNKEHFEIRYGKFTEKPWKDMTRLVRVSKLNTYTFNFEWLIGNDSEEERNLRKEAQRKMDFSLIEYTHSLITDHWEHTIYLCSCDGNLYSDVHWLYFHSGNPGEE